MKAWETRGIHYVVILKPTGSPRLILGFPGRLPRLFHFLSMEVHLSACNQQSPPISSSLHHWQHTKWSRCWLNAKREVSFPVGCYSAELKQCSTRNQVSGILTLAVYCWPLEEVLVCHRSTGLIPLFPYLAYIYARYKSTTWLKSMLCAESNQHVICRKNN